MKILFFVLLCIPLVIISFHDLKRRIIPNHWVLILVISGFAVSVINQSMSFALLGMIIPALPLLIAKYGLRFYIGAGDIKLLSALGAWLGWYTNLYVLLSGSLAALIYVVWNKVFLHRTSHSIPFGPFLSIAALGLYWVSKTG